MTPRPAQCDVDEFNRWEARRKPSEPGPADWPLDQLRRIARDNKRSLAELLAEAIAAWIVKHSAAACLAVLLLASVARADMSQLFIGTDSLIVDFGSNPVPPGLVTTSNASPAAIIDFVHYGASLDYLTGGLYFPIGADDHGWLYAPPITPTTTAPSPWCFEVSTGGDSAQWMVNALGNPHPGFTPVGTVIGNTDWLEHIADHGLYDAFGLHSVPLDSAGNPLTIGPIMQYAIQTLGGPSLPASPANVPEPSTLVILFVAALPARRKA